MCASIAWGHIAESFVERVSCQDLYEGGSLVGIYKEKLVGRRRASCLGGKISVGANLAIG